VWNKFKKNSSKNNNRGIKNSFLKRKQKEMHSKLRLQLLREQYLYFVVSYASFGG